MSFQKYTPKSFLIVFDTSHVVDAKNRVPTLIMAIALGVMLFCAMQSVARDLPPKDYPSLSMPIRQQAATLTDEELVTITCKFVWNDEEMPDVEPKIVAVQAVDVENYSFTIPQFGESEVAIQTRRGKAS